MDTFGIKLNLSLKFFFSKERVDVDFFSTFARS